MVMTERWTENGRDREVDREWSRWRSGQRTVMTERWTENGRDGEVDRERS